MIAVLLANGFEEIEALLPVDMLRRAGLEVKTVGINGKCAVGSHGISVICDAEPVELELSKVELVIFPGGMPGAVNLDESPFTDEIIAAVLKNGGRIAAICAAPLVLGRRGLLEGKLATCYPGFEKELRGAVISNDSVVTDGNITTAKGMGVALAFAEELISLLCGEEKRDELSSAIMEDKNEAPVISLNDIFFENVSDEEELPEAEDAAVPEKKEDEKSLNSYLNDKKFLEGVELAIRNGKITTSLLQRKLFIGYSKAAKLLDIMEDIGIISESNGQKPRDVLVTVDEWHELLAKIKLDK